jgi:hypothetical protein
VEQKSLFIQRLRAALISACILMSTPAHAVPVFDVVQGALGIANAAVILVTGAVHGVVDAIRALRQSRTEEPKGKRTTSQGKPAHLMPGP